MGKKRRASALTTLKNIGKGKLRKEKEFDGKYYKAGAKTFKGAKCKCGEFYPGASSIVYCNKCGHRSKALKPWELRRKQKNLKRIEYEKKGVA